MGLSFAPVLNIVSSCRFRVGQDTPANSDQLRLDMLPPIDLSTSQNNSKFVALHKQLKDLLDGDGCLRLPAKESEQRNSIEAVRVHLCKLWQSSETAIDGAVGVRGSSDGRFRDSTSTINAHPPLQSRSTRRSSSTVSLVAGQC